MEQLLSQKSYTTIPPEVKQDFCKIGIPNKPNRMCKNIVGVLCLCDKSEAVMMEYLELSFLRFGRDRCNGNSLDRLIHILNKEVSCELFAQQKYRT